MGRIQDPGHTRYAPDPPFGSRLLADRELAWVWLLVRVYVSLAWLVAAVFLLQHAESLAGTNTAHAIAEFGPEAKTYVSPLLFTILGVAEAVVSIMLLFGALTGPTAAIAILLSFNLLVPGPGATDPVALGGMMALVLAWKVSGWYGFDYWLRSDSSAQPATPAHRARQGPRRQ